MGLCLGSLRERRVQEKHVSHHHSIALQRLVNVNQKGKCFGNNDGTISASRTFCSLIPGTSLLVGSLGHHSPVMQSHTAAQWFDTWLDPSPLLGHMVYSHFLVLLWNSGQCNHVSFSYRQQMACCSSSNIRSKMRVIHNEMYFNTSTVKHGDSGSILPSPHQKSW